MMSDVDDREKILGFIPQKEIVYNKLLPYANRLDAESNSQLAEIKANLGKSIQLRDIKTGANHWCSRLSKYIRVYGRKFSKEDHVSFIKVLFELVIMPDLEFALIQKFASLLCTLLKKRDLLTRDDLVLQWRPLYELVKFINYSRYEEHGLQLFPQYLETSLKNLVTYSRVYFPVEATQEMLDEWRPLLCPWDITMANGLELFELFLPTVMSVEEHERGYKLWLPEFLDIWKTCLNCPRFESNLVYMFARLGCVNIGYIDWEPYIPMIFTRLLRSFNLPVGTSSLQVSRSNNHAYDSLVMGQWIASMLGGGSSTQEHINKLFKALESFYHPSNAGRWNLKLQRILSKMAQAVVNRVHRERYKKPTWELEVPVHKRLTDDDITQFVESLKPVIFLAMFSKLGTQDSATAMQQLSLLRPELIIPPLLEKMYPALETLTEPHRLTSCLQCIVAVSRPMVSSIRWYPEGRMHVIPLLNLSLPGVDYNDFRKTLMTFQLVSTLTVLAPILDCSELPQYHSDLTEDERELCSATVQFEDFVIQFMDRVFSLIEVSAQELSHTKLNTQEAMLEVGMVSTVSSVFHHCSPPIFKNVLKKLFRFLTSNVFEVQVAGRLAAGLLRAAAKADPAQVISMFVPHCYRVIKSHTDHPEVQTDEEVDHELLWNMMILSEVVRCDGKQLLPFGDLLLTTIENTVYMMCKQGNKMAANLLKHTLKALTQTYALNYMNSSHNLDKPLSEWNPLREWGKAGDLQNMNIIWHLPSTEEKEFVGQILKRLLVPALDKLKAYIGGESMTSEQLERVLALVSSCINGAGNVLPMWQGENIDLMESLVDLKTFSRVCSRVDDEVTIDGQNVRGMMADTLRSLLIYMLSSHEDDTKNLIHLIKLYSALLFYHGSQKEDFDSRWKSFQVVKRALEDKLHGNKNHIRALLVDRIQLQHELRVSHRNSRNFTAVHRDMYIDLLKLCVSRYSDVRKKAQAMLSKAMHHVPHSYHIILPDVLQYLRDGSTIPDYQFKGALYVIHGEKKLGLCLKRNWDTMNKLWPAFAQAQHSEKPSILKLVEEIASRVLKELSTTTLKIEVTDSCLVCSKLLWSTSNPTPSLPQASKVDLQQGMQAEKLRNEQWLQSYNQLVTTMVSVVENQDLMWKFRQITMELLCLLIRIDTPYPVCAVQMFTKNIVCDILSVRKLCLNALSAILKTHKRKHKKVVIDPFALGGGDHVANGDVHPGIRADNSWMLYNAKPDNQEMWDKCCLLDKTHWGFYTWPKKMLNYAPPSEQPKLSRSRDEMNEAEQVIYDCFTDTEFVDKLLQYLSLEDKKGKDKFHARHFEMLKGLFRNYDDAVVPLIRVHLERLVADTKHDTHEHSHRLAAEIISGLVRGSKHWGFRKTSAMWKWLLPVLQTALSNMGPESVADWGTCLATSSESRDPKMLHWLLEFLMDDPLKGNGGSLQDASRLYVLQGALAQQEWRIPSLLHRLLDYLEPQLAHSYKNVRERVGSTLTNIFLYDYILPRGKSTTSPMRSEFIQRILPKLEILEETVGADEKSNGTNGEVPMEVENGVDDGENSERKSAVKLIKTVLHWLKGNYGRMYQCSSEEMFKLLPVLCPLLAESADDELKRETEVALACMAQALLLPALVPVALKTMREVAGLKSWHARAAILNFIQVMVFCNLFLLQEKSSVTQIEDMVLHLLCDDQLEIREMAAVTLGGFLQCGYINMDQRLLKHFEKLSSTKLKKRRQLGEPVSMENLIKRHAGVLGLGACVQAYPYDVPEFIPQILMDLTGHVDDPQPIQMTVKKSLSNFRRTHHDNWHDHKHKFTDDQLVVLTDVLVSPNYYA